MPRTASAASTWTWSQRVGRATIARAWSSARATGAPGEQPRGRQQDVLVAEDLGLLRPGRTVTVEEHEVQPVEGRRVGLVLGQQDPRVRVLLADAAEDVGEQHVGDGLEGADVDPAATGEEAVDGLAWPGPAARGPTGPPRGRAGPAASARVAARRAAGRTDGPPTERSSAAICWLRLDWV